eukprot:TRINITY_DN9581_c0_g1_i3.p1 TRINITY_DN9581_c0_g1~~TRINITY_DN9581_c0_g1_i3.p1  ORF type:complete len:116 (+),score=22.01 TRINITY_DN9581_c0_g1_i3:74-421(+)
MTRRPPRSTLSSSSAASDVYKRQPLYIPLIIERHKSSQLPILDRYKYLVSGDLKLIELQQSIRKKLTLEKNQSLFFFINKNKLDKADSLLKDIYEKSKDSDGFLYIEYANFETFG